MKICIITYDYPYKSNQRFPFVKQLADEFSNQGCEVCVIAPYSLNHNRDICKFKSIEYTKQGNKVLVFRPKYISLPSIGPIKLTFSLHMASINRTFKHLPWKPDVLYCHFWNSGYEVYKYALKANTPLIVASGESSVDAMFPIEQRNQAYLNTVKGLVCVSSKNRDESVDLGLIDSSRCGVFPNSIDNNLFKQMNRDECRKQLGFPADAFIISFVGWFNERKGSKRVSHAITEIKDNNVYSIFVGAGSETPNCENILFQGALNHDEIPKYISASDVFVLPTRREGCCNAIVEALACGLPVISSNLQFNWDILNENNSIMVDPDDTEAIKAAILKLRDDKALRDKLHEGALLSANALTISNRAKNIIEFIKSRI